MMSRKRETSHHSPRGSSSGNSRLPFAFARANQAFLDGNTLRIGPNVTAVGLREARRRAGHVLSVVKESREDFDLALSRAYQDGAETNESADDNLSFDLEDMTSGGLVSERDLLDDVDEAPVIQLVNKMLLRAVRAEASDLHVEPREDGLRVRMRVDGFLQTILDRSDVPVRQIISRLKVMAGLDIAEKRLPQDGRIPLRLGGRLIDTRVSSMPGKYGERVVLRILDRSTGLVPLSELGLSPEQVQLLDRISALPNGIILATGPTGSGKTTTLYSLLKLAKPEERNIVTVEDPIEYDLPAVSQTQINSEIGMSFATGLRATLRQDPDVILVGEIRDAETATIASQAALTGHLVFSSLHANGSFGAVVRLRDLGLDNFLISSTLRAVIAQRLLRKLCLECATSHAPTEPEQALFLRHGIGVPHEIRSHVGCDACGQTGYAGRVGIFEMIEMSEALRTAIDSGASESELRDLALNPQLSLIGQGLNEVAAGTTSIVETLRVVGDTA